VHISPTVKTSPSKTFMGNPVATKVSDFSSRGPSSFAPAILKFFVLHLVQGENPSYFSN
jgi:uncharacterized protein YvpB